MTSKKNEDSEDKKNSKYIVIHKKKILIYVANSFQRLFQDYPCEDLKGMPEFISVLFTWYFSRAIYKSQNLNFKMFLKALKCVYKILQIKKLNN